MKKTIPLIVTAAAVLLLSGCYGQGVQQRENDFDAKCYALGGEVVPFIGYAECRFINLDRIELIDE